MRHRANPSFWKHYNLLPEETKELADKNYELLKRNFLHPSLQFKKTGRFWSVRVGRDYRALAVQRDKDFVWFWIGLHDEYKRRIGRR